MMDAEKLIVDLEVASWESIGFDPANLTDEQKIIYQERRKKEIKNWLPVIQSAMDEVRKEEFIKSINLVEVLEGIIKEWDILPKSITMKPEDINAWLKHYLGPQIEDARKTVKSLGFIKKECPFCHGKSSTCEDCGGSGFIIVQTK